MRLLMRKFQTTNGWHRVVAIAAILLSLGFAACANAPDIQPRPEIAILSSDATHTMFVSSNGWHSSIVLERGDIPPGRIPEIIDFPEARFLEFGWGDAEYYPSERHTIGMTLSAALYPTPSVVHVVGLMVPPAERYPEAEVVTLMIDAAGLERLSDFIGDSFDRGDDERAVPTGPGLYANSRFYPATGEFHLFNTCNTWTARALATAGFGVSRSGIQTAEELMHQVRQLGK